MILKKNSMSFTSYNLNEVSLKNFGTNSFRVKTENKGLSACSRCHQNLNFGDLHSAAEICGKVL